MFQVEQYRSERGGRSKSGTNGKNTRFQKHRKKRGRNFAREVPTDTANASTREEFIARGKFADASPKKYPRQNRNRESKGSKMFSGRSVDEVKSPAQLRKTITTGPGRRAEYLACSPTIEYFSGAIKSRHGHGSTEHWNKDRQINKHAVVADFCPVHTIVAQTRNTVPGREKRGKSSVERRKWLI